MTDFIQRREINAFHIRFDLVIAERVTRLRNQADKCVLAVVKDNKLMVAGVPDCFVLLDRLWYPPQMLLSAPSSAPLIGL